MAKKNTQVIRVDSDFVRFLQDVSITRVKNNLERKTLPPREITRMTLNAESKNALFKELTTKGRIKI